MTEEKLNSACGGRAGPKYETPGLKYEAAGPKYEAAARE